MKLPRILSKVFRDFWCVTERTHDAIVAALDARLSGESPAKLLPIGNDDDQDRESGGYAEYQDIAIIPVEGILGKHLSQLEIDCGGASMDLIGNLIDIALASPRITKILFNINSPGGTATGTPELARKILEAGRVKQTVAYTDCDCCSAALWLASQCNHFYASPSSETGSVGVRMILLDYSKYLDAEGVKVNPIFSGKYKLAGADFKPLEPDEREMFQTESDRLYAQFKDAVNVKRPVAPEYLQGQIYRGEIAAELGFVDSLADELDDALVLTSQLPVMTTAPGASQL